MRDIRQKRIVIGYALLVCALIAIAYGRSLWQGFAPVDDDILIYNNLAVRGVTFDHLKTIFTTFDPELYIPLTLLSFQIDYLIGGLDPFVYHLTNLFLHAANALLVAWLLILFTHKRCAGLMGGLVFAVHPLNTEAVVWLAGRKDLLSVFFCLLSFILYIHARRGSRFSYGGSIIAFALSLLAKVSTITLPALLILYDILIERRKIDRKFFLDKVPYAFLSGIFMVIARAGKERVLAANTFLETVLMAGKSTLFYLEKFFLPWNLSIFYEHTGPISIASAEFLVPLTLLTLLLLLTLRGARRTHALVFGSLFFLIALAPTFLNFNKAGIVYFAVDRYMYLPMVGLLYVTLSLPKGDVVHAWFGKLTKSCVLILCMILSILQTRIWDSPYSLFSHSLALYPNSITARTAVVQVLKEQGKTEEAFNVLRDGLAYGDHLQLHLSAGTLYASNGQLSEAREQFAIAAGMDGKNPEPIFSLGSLDEQAGDFKSAQANYERAVALDTSYVSARVRLAGLYKKNGKFTEAKLQLTEAVTWNPNSFEALLMMGQLLEEEKKWEEAITFLGQAEQLRPNDIPLLLVLARYQLHAGNTDAAKQLLQRVLKMDQGNTEAISTLKSL